MKAPFIRACRKHKVEIEDHTAPGDRKETLMCPEGHRIRSWLVMDSLGEVVAMAFVNEAPRIISEELARVEIPKITIRPPERFCHKGHFEWSLEGNEYRCRVCRREQAFRRNERLKEALKNERSHR